MTLELELSDADFKRISDYAATNRIGVTEFVLKTLFEKIEVETVSDADLLKVSDEIMERHKKVYEELAK